jgi:hypothetical protein
LSGWDLDLHEHAFALLVGMRKDGVVVVEITCNVSLTVDVCLVQIGGAFQFIVQKIVYFYGHVHDTV